MGERGRGVPRTLSKKKIFLFDKKGEKWREFAPVVRRSPAGVGLGGGGWQDTEEEEVERDGGALPRWTTLRLHQIN